MNLELKNINFFRILFTLIIIYGHTIQLYIMPQYGNLPFFQNLVKHTSFNYGYICEFFFIISGFFMYYTFSRNTTFKSFIVNKIARLWPVLIFCILIFYILYLFDISNFEKFGNILAAFFITQSFVNVHANINVSWYINVIFWTYILYFSLFKIIKPENRVSVVALYTFFAYTILFNKVNLYSAPTVWGGGF